MKKCRTLTAIQNKKNSKFWQIAKYMVSTFKPVKNDHPWNPPKMAIVQRWPVFGGFSIKIGIKISPLLTGGR
jgi:hypothetical protein